MAPGEWPGRADVAQLSLSELWWAPWPQLLHNTHPTSAAEDERVFNYWWLAHVIDVQVDAYLRTGDGAWLDAARDTASNIRTRNGDSLFNDYFDDMLWYALALLRVAEATPPGAAGGGHDGVMRDVVALWDHVLEHGWTDVHGESVSWRTQQPDYKNTPANGPFIILGARLARVTGDATYLTWAQRSMDWLEAHLVGDDGFVEDGLGREGGDVVDTHWRFTYNQGLYIGACVELARAARRGAGSEERAQEDRDRRAAAWLDKAERTALTSIRELATDGVFRREGNLAPDDVPEADGGDVGLFKGIWYRYAAQLLAERDVPGVAAFVRSSTDALWAHARIPAPTPSREEVGATARGSLRNGERISAAAASAGAPGELLRAGDDWTRPAPPTVGYSTQLSAVMALEVRALLEA
ncbi:glycoside hydrolase family 76 [Beutenbergia cavernae DSM 12333]|uniref:Glycoside hydrolase family 76 n=1 Tax=Beutenbergia cavernae (strain ATCC BAA-8 / DSM 12333 / CCUG 43141 / JCM 11478 / NBRC 16432 / NCIMB 13614 / HKI 0122) TaxID=471853 RepID=C5C588_BEUC1|nr:glycoside hydrolase family 76 [Beutenbergia cavernae DSM 12333]